MEEKDKTFDESTQADPTVDIPIEDGDAEEKAADQAAEKEEADKAADSKADTDKKEEIETAGAKDKKSTKLEIELKKKDEKISDLDDHYKRLMAECDNARKITEKEKSQMYDFGAKDVLEKILPVVDNFESGIDGLSDEEKEGAFAKGIIKIYQQLMTTLDGLGVKAMNAEGQEFNPDFHNAEMHEDNEEMGENLVAQELQKGYMYKDSVLRHAMVKVVN